MGRWTAATAVAWTLACAGCDGDRKSDAMQGPPPVPVEVITMRPEAIADRVDFVGQLEAEESVQLRPEIAAILDEVAFEEGQRVRKGDVLFRLRSAEQRAAFQEATARERLANDVYQRTKRLFEEKIASDSEMVKAFREIEVARAAVARAQVDLSRTEIRAPFDGVVGARVVSPGDRVSPDTQLASLDATDRLKLAFAIPEIAVGYAKPGLRFEVRVAQYPGKTFPGEVYFVSPSLDPKSRRLLVKGRIANPDSRLRPGLFANVAVEIARRDEALVVPDSALVYESGRVFVWRVRPDGTPDRVAVEKGIAAAGRVEVTKGLSEGDVVVVAGTNKIFPGARIQSLPAREDTASPS